MLLMNDKPDSHLLTKSQLMVQQPLNQNHIFSIFRIIGTDIYKNYQTDNIHNFGYHLIRELSKEVTKYKNHFNQFMNAVQQLRYFSNGNHKNRQSLLAQFIYCLNNNLYDLTPNNNYLGLFYKFKEQLSDKSSVNTSQYGLSAGKSPYNHQRQFNQQNPKSETSDFIEQNEQDPKEQDTTRSLKRRMSSISNFQKKNEIVEE